MDCALRKCKANLRHRVWETQTTDALVRSVAHQMVRLVMPLHFNISRQLSIPETWLMSPRSVSFLNPTSAFQLQW